MVKRRFLYFSAVVAVLNFASSGKTHASTIDIVRLNEAAMETVHGLRDDTGTYGADLHGAQITSYYADGSSEEFVWQSNARTFTEPNGETWSTIDGYAAGQNSFLRMTWDGFEVSASNVLTFLSIDLAGSGAVFDTTTTLDYDYLGNPTNGSTLGSDFGYQFEYYSDYAAMEGHTTTTYSGIVNVAGEEAVGDLFTTMMIDFAGLSTNGIFGNVAFRSDIDVLEYSNDLSPVPLSSSLAFLIFGLGGMGLLHSTSRKRRASKT